MPFHHPLTQNWILTAHPSFLLPFFSSSLARLNSRYYSYLLHRTTTSTRNNGRSYRQTQLKPRGKLHHHLPSRSSSPDFLSVCLQAEQLANVTHLILGKRSFWIDAIGWVLIYIASEQSFLSEALSCSYVCFCLTVGFGLWKVTEGTADTVYNAIKWVRPSISFISFSITR